MAYTPKTPVGVLLAAYGAGSATWDETMTALRDMTTEEWGITEEPLDPDRLSYDDPDWWQSVEDRALGSPVGNGSPLTDLRNAKFDGIITPEQWEQVYDLVAGDEE